MRSGSIRRPSSENRCVVRRAFAYRGLSALVTLSLAAGGCDLLAPTKNDEPSTAEIVLAPAATQTVVISGGAVVSATNATGTPSVTLSVARADPDGYAVGQRALAPAVEVSIAPIAVGAREMQVGTAIAASPTLTLSFGNTNVGSAAGTALLLTLWDRNQKSVVLWVDLASTTIQTPAGTRSVPLGSLIVDPSSIGKITAVLVAADTDYAGVAKRVLTDMNGGISNLAPTGGVIPLALIIGWQPTMIGCDAWQRQRDGISTFDDFLSSFRADAYLSALVPQRCNRQIWTAL